MQDFAKAVEILLKYTIENIVCNDVRVELFHFNDENGKMGANPEIKTAISKNGFKWKTLQNDPEKGTRA